MRTRSCKNNEVNENEWLTSTRGYPSGHYWDVCDKLVRLKIFDAPTLGQVTLNSEAEGLIKGRARTIRAGHPRKTAEKVVTQAIMLEIVERVGTIKVKNWVDMASMVLGYIKQVTSTRSCTLERWFDESGEQTR